MPTEQISLGVATKLFDADATAAPVNGTTFALGAANKRKVITWQTFFASAPSGCSITIEHSLDGTTWGTLDTSTATAGEVRTTVATAATYIRGRKATQTGGGALTLTIVAAAE